MSFSNRIVYFLVHSFGYSNKEAKLLLQQGRVQVDGTSVLTNDLLGKNSEVKVDGLVKRVQKKMLYLKFHKPAGYQSSLNAMVLDNLAGFFEDFDELFIAGRLDKQSEGLLLLSNDGKWVEEVCNPKFEKEKEYAVILDRAPDADFADRFMRGVKLGDYTTKPCFCRLEGKGKITVILTEGKNRQIRRMCLKLGYHVLSLRRERIGPFLLNGLRPGRVEILEMKEFR